MKAAHIVIAIIIIGFAAFIVFTPEGQREGALPRGPQVGKPAPAFALKDTGGKLWSLDQMKGSVVIVNFWATWCPPCKGELPSIDRLFRSMLDREDFQIVTILYQDSPDKAMEYFKSNGYGMPILLDPTTETALRYGLTGVPETFFIDKQGVLREKFIGPAEFFSPEIQSFVAELLKG